MKINKSGTPSILALVLLTGAALLGMVPSQAADQPVGKKYGKTLVGTFDAPIGIIDAWNKFQPEKPDKRENAMVGALMAKTSDWQVAAVSLSDQHNPYTVVLKVKGRADNDGDVVMMWQAGWVLEDTSSKSFLLPGLSRLNVKAGETIVIEGAAAPGRFERKRELGMLIGLVRADNWKFESAQVELWSGIPEATFAETVLSFRGALVGLVMFGIVLWFRRR